jgi:hypothetical protein
VSAAGLGLVNAGGGGDSDWAKIPKKPGAKKKKPAKPDTGLGLTGGVKFDSSLLDADD